MRKYIDIINEAAIISEGVFYKGPIKTLYGETEILILKNPSRAQFAGLKARSEYGEIRGLLDNDLFIWDGTDVTHSDVSRALHIDGSDLHLNDGHIEVNDVPDDLTDEQAAEMASWIKNSPHIHKLYGGAPPVTLSNANVGSSWNF